jgi:hypothetical protein
VESDFRLKGGGLPPSKIDYYDDDPPPRREQPSGTMENVVWGQTTAAIHCAEMDPDLVWRIRRNNLIKAAVVLGYPVKHVGAAFGLGQVWARALCRDMRVRTQGKPAFAIPPDVKVNTPARLALARRNAIIAALYTNGYPIEHLRRAFSLNKSQMNVVLNLMHVQRTGSTYVDFNPVRGRPEPDRGLWDRTVERFDMVRLERGPVLRDPGQLAPDAGAGFQLPWPIQGCVPPPAAPAVQGGRSVRHLHLHPDWADVARQGRAHDGRHVLRGHALVLPGL